jgi:hypothetical protein
MKAKVYFENNNKVYHLGVKYLIYETSSHYWFYGTKGLMNWLGGFTEEFQESIFKQFNVEDYKQFITRR